MVAMSACPVQALGIPPCVLGSVFQRRLWLAEPGLRGLAVAPEAQGRVLLRCLELLAAHRGGERFPVLCRRLARHLHLHGFHASHYDAAGAALLGGLREVMNLSFDDAAETYWGDLYGESAEAMLASLAEGMSR
jgi:hypothetical protein